MRVITLPLGSTAANCYIVDVGNGKCIVIDPGFDGRSIFSQIERQGLSLHSVLFTHMHFDHIMGVNELQSLLDRPVPMYIHKDDRYGLNEGSINLSSMAYGYSYSVLGEVTPIENGELLPFGEICLEAVHTPGHTPGSVCYHEKSEKVIFSGDTLFKGTIGRTDFPGGDISEMTDSLSLLASLDCDITLYPGHGDKTTIAYERKTNPYLR